MVLSFDEQERYSRHLCLPEVGEAGQERLKRSRVLVVGLGGLGSPLASYLAAAGVGTLGLADFDEVSRSNLQRQILYTEDDVGRPKVWAASSRLRAQNPSIRVIGHEERVEERNAPALLAGYDVVADACDSFEARYGLNAACRRAGKPLVHASLHRFEGQLTVFTSEGPCYRCLFPTPPQGLPRCGDAGVLGALPGILGSMQAAEVLKLILGLGTPLISRLLLVDALRMRFEEVGIPRDPACPCCGEQPEDPAIASGARGELDDDELSGTDPRWHAPCWVWLDVREAVGDPPKADRARHLPLSQLAAALPMLSPSQPILVLCQSGEVSGYAVRVLRGAGIPAYGLRGGYRTLLALGSGREH